MLTLSERFTALWETLKGRRTVVKGSVPIPSSRHVESGTFPDRLTPRKSYFKLVINEMYLTEAREWTEEFDPMAVVVSEFTYAGKRTAVPHVVGPGLLKNHVEKLPQGMRITDTQVAGIHPYMGGNFAVSLILARVKHGSYARRLLRVVESVSGAFPVGLALQPHLKVAGAVMGGVEELFGLGDTKPLVGHRWEYDEGLTQWLRPGYFALVNEDESKTRDRDLAVVKGRLVIEPDEKAPAFRDADYMLYSLIGMESRTDTAQLPFDQKFNESIMPDAMAGDDNSWDRAKAGLVALYKDILGSHDLTWDQAHHLCAEYQAKMVQIHDLAKKGTMLDKAAVVSNDANYVVASFEGEEAELRRAEIFKSQNILKLP